MNGNGNNTHVRQTHEQTGFRGVDFSLIASHLGRGVKEVSWDYLYIQYNVYCCTGM